MSIESVIYDKLNDEADGVDTYVGSGATARIFRGYVPQGQALPAIRFTHIATSYSTHLTGVTPLAEAVFQVDGYAATNPDAIALGDAIRASLQDYRSLSTDPEVLGTYEEGHVTSYEEPIDSSDTGSWVVSQDFRFIYSLS